MMLHFNILSVGFPSFTSLEIDVTRVDDSVVDEVIISKPSATAAVSATLVLSLIK